MSSPTIFSDIDEPLERTSQSSVCSKGSDIKPADVSEGDAGFRDANRIEPLPCAFLSRRKPCNKCGRKTQWAFNYGYAWSYRTCALCMSDNERVAVFLYIEDNVTKA